MIKSKKVKKIVNLSVLLILVCVYCLYVFVTSKSETYDAQLITKEPLHGGIRCFDVNDNGDVLVQELLS